MQKIKMGTIQKISLSLFEICLSYMKVFLPGKHFGNKVFVFRPFASSRGPSSHTILHVGLHVVGGARK